jgi:hypothetical protein
MFYLFQWLCTSWKIIQMRKIEILLIHPWIFCNKAAKSNNNHYIIVLLNLPKKTRKTSVKVDCYLDHIWPRNFHAVIHFTIAARYDTTSHGRPNRMHFEVPVTTRMLKHYVGNFSCKETWVNTVAIHSFLPRLLHEICEIKTSMDSSSSIN